MNWIFFGLIAIAVVTAAFTGTMPKVTEASLGSAKSAVELAIGLVGQLTLWLGLVGVLRQAGVLRSLATALAPLMRRLFPEVPPDHPAMGAMIMNISANVLGLGNAATPFGLKAMQELNTLNPREGVATNAMVLFLVINTAGVAVMPLSVIAVRASLGSADPTGVVLPTLIATLTSTTVSVLVCKLLERLPVFEASRAVREAPVTPKAQVDEVALKKAEDLAALAPKASSWRRGLALVLLAAIVSGLIQSVVRAPETVSAGEQVRGLLSGWLLPLLIVGIVALGFARGVRLYEVFIAAAKEGFQTAVSIIPFLVGILVAIGMFRASGAMDWLVQAVAPLVRPFGFPAEALPMVFIRPLSGSGALGVMSDALKTHGPDSFVGYLVSTLNGSTETTFYVLALYFGAAQVKVLRHALIACLVTDVVGPVTAFVACRVFFAGAP